MSEFLEKANTNQQLLELFYEKFPGKFEDWTVVIMFYCAIHHLKHFCLDRFGKPIGDTHYDIRNNVAPSSKSKIVDIEQGLWDNYFAIYQASRNARYFGIPDKSLYHDLMKQTAKDCRGYFTQFKLYVKK